MIVHPPNLRVRDGTLRVWARIEYETSGPQMPGALWFEMPADQEQLLSARMDVWAASLFLVAMRRGERLRLKGCISDRLAHGIQEYQRVASAWYPKEVKRVTFDAAGYEHAIADAPSKVGLAFSGGVDSFFTLWSHVAPQEASPAYRVTHGVFIEGIDIAYAEESSLRACRDAYGELYASLGMELLFLRTNVRDLYPEADWGSWMCYPFLSGVGLLFGKIFRRFYVAAGETYWDPLYGGRRMLLDQFFSTESMDLVHDGAGYSRAEKIAAIAPWEAIWRNLRVCYTVPNGLLNCCRCSKCIHTMLCLDLAGHLERVSTFPLKYTRAQFRTTAFDLSWLGTLIDTKKYVSELGRKDVDFDMTVVLALVLTRGAAAKAHQRFRRRLRRKQ